MNTLKAGDKVPDFSVLNDQGKPVSLSDYKGKKLVVFFYPKASTPGCTAEACNLRDYYKDLQDKGYEIIGVSADTEAKHQKFIEKYSLPFPLIADTEKEVIEAFGVWGEKKFMGKVYDGIHRVTYVIDEEGTLVKEKTIILEEEKSVISDVIKLVSDKLRTKVEYTESSKVFTCKGLLLAYPNVLEDILSTIDIKAKNISKPIKGQVAGDTTFKI